MTGSATLTINRESYPDLLSHYCPTAIQTDAQNEAAIALMEKIDHNPHATAAEQQLCELLSVLVMQYEETHYSFPSNMQASPLDMLKELMVANDLKQADLVGVLGSSGVISEICNGKRSISKTMAFKLAEMFNVEPSLFLG